MTGERNGALSKFPPSEASFLRSAGLALPGGPFGDRDHLKAQLLAAIRATGGTCAKSEASMLLARALGFARTGAGIAAVVESLLRSLVRTKQVESRAGQIRVIRAGVAV